MRRDRLGANAMVLVAGAIVIMGGPRTAGAGDDTPAKPGVEARAAFARLKKLAGTWNAEIAATGKSADFKAKIEKHKVEHDPKMNVIYKLTGAGSALVETQFPGARTRWSRSTTSMATTCG